MNHTWDAEDDLEAPLCTRYLDLATGRRYRVIGTAWETVGSPPLWRTVYFA